MVFFYIQRYEYEDLDLSVDFISPYFVGSSLFPPLSLSLMCFHLSVWFSIICLLVVAYDCKHSRKIRTNYHKALLLKGIHQHASIQFKDVIIINTIFLFALEKIKCEPEKSEGAFKLF